MSPVDLLRPSRDGDQFHYTWAARQALRLLDERSGLCALYVEAVDPSEHPADSSTDQHQREDRAPTDAPAASASPDDDGDLDTGDEVIDLAEYWGSTHIDEADRVVYRQFKHSTLHADEPWTMSFLTKTLTGFARKYRSLRDGHPAAVPRVRFEFVSNRVRAPSAQQTLQHLRDGTDARAAAAVRTRLAGILSPDEIVDLCQRLDVDERAPSLLRLRHLLETQVADLLPGAPNEQALLLREMISDRATSIAGSHPAVRRENVLAALKTSEYQLFPAPNLIPLPRDPIVREQFLEVCTDVCSVADRPIVVHGPGGVGKSVLAATLGRYCPPGSITIVFDCFGNGSYRRTSAPRHQAKQGFVQLTNELTAHGLCDPLVPSATADDADYAQAFLRRLNKAAQTLSAVAPEALLIIVVDAADNAAMVAADDGSRSFVNGLVREEELPANTRLVVTCRTERMDILNLPARHHARALDGFTLDETTAYLELSFSSVTAMDAAEFHVRTGCNPRIQATVLDATSTLDEALAWLAPDPVSPAEALDSVIERQVLKVRDDQHGSAAEIDRMCVGLAALRPMIPIRVLAEIADVHQAVVRSFVADLGRPLLVDGDTVQFRDEPTETWFRSRYRPTGHALDDFLLRLRPLADRDAYVAASLPALLFEANRFDDLVRLALSDDALPDNALPVEQRNEVQRREIAQQRSHFALTAALSGDHDFEAASRCGSDPSRPAEPDASA